MGGKDSKYEVVYRGGEYNHQIDGKWVFFQRERVHGGGFWLGQAFYDGYVFGIDRPVSLREGIDFLLRLDRPAADNRISGDGGDFELM